MAHNTPPTTRTVETTVRTTPLMPIVYTPSVYMLNRISMLQTVASTMGVAIALPEDYRYGDIDNVASGLSDIIEGGI